MVKKDNSISSAKMGMNKDSHISNLQEGEYPHAKNSNFWEEGGEGYNIQNEHSNILASKFKEGFKVLGNITDVNLNETYFFLKNEGTGASEVGKIFNDGAVPNLEDTLVDCGDCDQAVQQELPLEERDQVAYQVYQTIINDTCDTDTKQCLNFNIDSPIKTGIIKNEKCGKILYWTDDLNPPRYLQLDNLDQYNFTGNILCGEDFTEETCLACDKLEIFKDALVPVLEPTDIVLGGNLKRGMYQAVIAYCDEAGNEQSRYFTVTEPVPIFDVQNNALLSSQTADETNYALKIKVTNLDKNFTHYKVVIIQNADINRATSYFIEGIHSTSDNTILYTTDTNKERTSLDKLVQFAVRVERLEKIATANNYLLGKGVTYKKRLNLQRVVNLIGEFVQWQSHIATENLYKDGINSAKYRQFIRDESYPLALRFIEDGEYSPTFPLIGRNAITSDNEVIDEENIDSRSINRAEIGCSNERLEKRWQLYNTATEVGRFTQGANIATSEVEIEGQASCFIGDETTPLAEITTDVTEAERTITISLEQEQSYVNLEYYLEQNLEDILAATHTPDSSLDRIKELFTLANYTSDTCLPIGYEEDGILLANCELQTQPENSIEIIKIIGETATFIPAEFPDGYPFAQAPTNCNLLRSDGLSYFNGSGSGYCAPAIYRLPFPQRSCTSKLRSELPFPSSPTIAEIINPTQDLQTTVNSFFVNYYFGFQESDLITSKQATATTGNTDEDIVSSKLESNWGTDFKYDNFLYNNARWYKLENFEDTFVFHMSRDSNLSPDLFGTREYRLCIYKSTSNSVDPIYITLKSITDTLKIKFTIEGNDVVITNGETAAKTITNGGNSTYYLSIDTPYHILCGDICASPDIPEVTSLYGNFSESNPDGDRPTHYNFSSAGCYSLAVTPETNTAVNVKYDTIKVGKQQLYDTLCTYDEPIIEDDCKALPFAFGSMGYTESTEGYPDNAELYDSSNLIIEPADIPVDVFYEVEGGTDKTFRAFFQEKYTNAGAVDAEGNYVLNDTLDLRCKGIRHFKFPDNKVSNFMYGTQLSNLSDSLIYPLGVKLDGKIVETVLNIAVKNNLISQTQKDKIQGFELVRGDRSAERSITAKGITFDLYDYQKKNKTVSYANYPLNSFGKDVLHYNSEDRIDFIPQPSVNHRWTFSSPDTDYNRVTIPNIMKVEGFTYGNTIGKIDLVEDHPKWTILGRELKRTADRLALLEVVAEAVIGSMQAFSNWTQVVGFTNTLFDGAFVATPVIAAFQTITAAVFKFARYKYQWLETFRNLGKRRNFAAYGTSVAKMNFLKTNMIAGNELRHLNIRTNIKSGRLSFTDKIEGERLELNHVDREDTVLLSTGKTYGIEYPTEYINYDNTTTNPNNSSKTFASQANACSKGLSEDIERNAASMYVSLKTFLPSQYGTIGSIRWIPINQRGNLSTDNLFFGGDTFISRHTLRRPFPFFNTTAFDQADMTPYEYKFDANIGEEPRFFCNFQTDSDEREGGKLLPFKNSEFNFDCETNANGSYLKEPSKFYLWYNGIPSFLTESVINTNYRYAKAEPWENFYPNEPDYMRWTQEKENPIRRGNNFFYNSEYSLQTLPTGVLTFPDTYNQEDYDCKTDAPNGIIYSLPDNSENNFIDPWLIFRPNDKYEFPTKYGKLNAIKGIESEQVMAIFDNTTAIFNAFDQLTDDGQNPQARETGLGGIFARRPRVFTETALGYAGSQHYPILSCEYGHFYVDSDRGQIFKIPAGGEGLEEISASSGNKPSGMKNWFKQNLPFKIKQFFPNVDIDNPYNGFGITMGYDSRYRRIFITKKDFIPINKSLIQEVDGVLYKDVNQRVEESDLIDVSWTISYSLESGNWASFFDFKPNYYVDHNNFFQTGKNTDNDEHGLWSHLLTNKSFQVFYGKKYDWEIEVPVINKGVNQVLESVSYRLDSRRYFNEYDFIQNKETGFEEAYIYNNSNLSGKLKLTLQKTLKDLSKYPKTVGNTQEILQTQQDGIMRFNYFYNRVKKEASGIPLFNKGKNGVEKEINTNAISFFGKSILERLRGNSFIINLSSSETKHKKIFELAQFNKNLYSK